MDFDDDPQMDELRTEAIDTAEDLIEQLNLLLDDLQRGSVHGDLGLKQLRMLALSFKSIGASFNIPVLSAMAFRFEDFVTDINALDERALKDSQTFVDRFAEVVDGHLDADAEKISELMRRLPAKGGFNVDDVEVKNVEVMLVMPPGLASKMVSRELQECGYRVVNVTSSIQALMLVPNMRPDLIIAANVMPELTGVDIACAFRAMPTTANIPVAMITSQVRGHASLKALPDDVPLLRKGEKFSDDVADALEALGLT